MALTLIRSCLESAVTVLWLVQSQEAIYAFVGEEHRQRRTLSKGMARAASKALREDSGRVAHIDEESIATVAAPEARNFGQLCESLTGGHEAYVYYRIPSGMAHPCSTLADFYLAEDDDAPGGCKLLVDPTAIGHDSWLYISIVSMMWAHRALDHLKIDHPHRSGLRAIARALHVPETLELTPKAHQAALVANQQRRQAEWKGKRPRA